MRPISSAVAVLALATLAACASSGKYVNVSRPDAVLAADQAECEKDAARDFPPLYKATELGDQNESSRRGATSRCLFKRGWRWEKDRGAPPEPQNPESGKGIEWTQPVTPDEGNPSGR